ncbi:MAG TPA: site-2 protease family protein [Candidatus Sulfotelmatobacter sp.]|nr:site-2 protease family protein [Candidatus Sulfotelmatobacter sp.]
MYDDDQRPPEDRLQQPRQGKQGGAARTAGGAVLGLAALVAKFFAAIKAGLLALGGLKFLIFVPKLISFGSLFASILLYAALFGGWKIAIVFVAMILVHELGHYFTWRNFGVPARLPVFIPGLGAFTAAPGGTPAQNVAAAIAGPIFGIGAATVCWIYGLETGERFWIACAYIGFFLNFFNLIPLPPFDGGAIAGAIDARLWYVGIPLFALFMIFFAHSAFSLIFLVLIGFAAYPRLRALWHGQIDPRASGLTPRQRLWTGIAYFATGLIALAGASATIVENTAAR